MIIILLRLLRVEQWYKNLIIFIPLFFSTNSLYPQQLLLGFFGFCFVSSITYMINDWLDRDKDLLHPIKKERPLASGRISEKTAIFVGFLLAIMATLIIWKLGSFYGYILLTYFVLTNLYSLGLKNVPFLDIVMIATNFTLRMMAGMLSFPPWSDFAYFSLIFGVIIVGGTHKRNNDIKLIGVETAIKHKPVLKYYTPTYNYIYRGVGYLIVLISFYFLWQNGLHIVKILSLIILLFATSFIFSKNPEFTSKPQWLFRSKVWLLVLFINIIVFVLA